MQEGSDYLAEVRAVARMDFEQRKIYERELARYAPDYWEHLKEAASDEDVAVRRLVIELMRRAQPPAEELPFLFQRLGQEPDVKARRRLAVALGKLGDSKHTLQLLSAYDAEDHRFVKASIALALGELGFREWTESMQQESKGEGPLAEALRKAIRHTRTKRMHQQVSSLPPLGTYLLRCYPGAEELVLRELAMHQLSANCCDDPGFLRIKAETEAEMKVIANLRTITHYGKAEKMPRHTNRWPAALGHLVIELQERYNLPDAQSYRLSLPRQETKLAAKKLLRSCCNSMERQSRWENSASNYEVLLEVVETARGRRELMWHHAQWQKAERDAERKVIAAAIHPSLAAALCLLATDFQKPESQAPMIDPCCGSGTILTEWHGLFPELPAQGYDLDHQALKIAKQNTSGIQTLQVGRGNMTKLPMEDGSARCIIANLPFGVRVKHGSNRKLYSGFAREALRVVQPGGTIVAYTADYKAFEAAWSDDVALEVITRLKMQGGMVVHIFKITRTT